MTIIEKLSAIQNEMHVPKNLHNSFGNYDYRNAETIFDTAKPICAKHKTTLVVSDEIVLIGERYYVKAIAKLLDWETEQAIENIAYAREEESKKGMDSSQVTGACSSYARKYALNGLFNLDDNKDADTDEFQTMTSNEQKATDKQVEFLTKLYSIADINKILEHYKVESCKDLPMSVVSQYIDNAQKRNKERNAK